MKLRQAAAIVFLSTPITSAGLLWAADGPEIRAIKKRNVLRLGRPVDAAKFGCRHPKTNSREGFEANLANGQAKAVAGKADKPTVVPVPAKMRVPVLGNGDVDMATAPLTVANGPQKSRNFRNPHFVDGLKLPVKKSFHIKSLSDLRGKTIGLPQSSTAKSPIQEKTKKLVKINFNDIVGRQPKVSGEMNKLMAKWELK